MQRFVKLYVVLAGNAPDRERFAATERYFDTAPPDDAAWAACTLVGPRQRPLVSSARLRAASIAVTGVAPWLFAASHAATGDIAETAALLLPPWPAHAAGTLTHWMQGRLAPLAGLRGRELALELDALWRELDRDGRWVVNRILLSTARANRSEQLVLDVLARSLQCPVPEVARRLARSGPPDASFLHTPEAAHGSPPVPEPPDSSRPSPQVRGDAAQLHHCHAVLVYVQPGTGSHASLHADCTFALWQDRELVAVAKAAAVLPREEARSLDAWVRNHTRERFGPVRSVEPSLVFEIAFESVTRSKRHKCGVIVRAPRVVRWVHDAVPESAGTLEALVALAVPGEAPS